MAVEDVSIIIKEKQTTKIVPLLKEVASPQNVDCFSDQAKFNRKGLLRQLLMVVISNSTMILVGMNISYSAITYTAMLDTSNSMALTENEFSWFASVSSLMGPLGGILLSLIFDRYGRKVTFLTIAILFLIGWTMIAISSQTCHWLMLVQLYIGRSATGIAHGLSTSPCCLYSAEIVRPAIRGRMFILATICTATGILTMYIMGYFLPFSWRTISMICAVLTLVSTIATVFIWESPRWLISKDRLAEAEQSMRYFRGVGKRSPDTAVYQDEFDAIVADSKLTASITPENESTLSALCRPEVWKPIAIVIGLGAFQKLSGIYLILMYAVKMCMDAGVQINPFLCSICIGVVRVCATLMSGFAFDWFGRKWTTIWSSSLMAACMFGIGAYTYVGTNSFAWFPVFAILLFMFASTFGLQALPFYVMAEILPMRHRGLGSGVVITGLDLASFVTVKMYPSLVSTIGAVNVFYVLGTVAMASVPYVHYFVPETRGKTLEEIEQSFRRKRR